MRTFGYRVAMLALAFCFGSLGNEADAGFRHFRLYRHGCAGSCCSRCLCGCSAPLYVTAPCATTAYSGCCDSMSLMTGSVSDFSSYSSVGEPQMGGGLQYGGYSNYQYSPQFQPTAPNMPPAEYAPGANVDPNLVPGRSYGSMGFAYGANRSAYGFGFGVPSQPGMSPNGYAFSNGNSFGVQRFGSPQFVSPGFANPGGLAGPLPPPPVPDLVW